MMGDLRRLAINDDGFVFDPTTGSSYTVNEVGLAILRMFIAGKSEDDVRARILDEYEATGEMVERDLTDFQQQLRFFGLGDA